MSSIAEIFGSSELDGGSEAPFDPAALQGALDQVMRDRPPLGEPGGAPPAPPLPPDPANSGEPPAVDDGGAPPAPPVGTEPVAPAAPPAPAAAPPGEVGAVPPAPAPAPAAPSTPFDGMSDLELQEHLAIRAALADPERALAVRQAYLGVAPTPPVATAPPAPAPPPPPTLPDEIDPDSFEARLWHENQEMKTRLAAIETSTQAQVQQSAQQVNIAAARTATQAFAAKYGDRLSPEEMQAVAIRAGAQKLPEAFMRTNGGNIEDAMSQSLEFVMRTDDGLLGKVLGNPTPPVAPALPSGTAPAAVGRKRTLTALSSAASPSGEAPRPTPITHREDGRIDETSRQSLIAQLMSGINAEREGN